MQPLETNTDVLEPIIFCFLNTKDLGLQKVSEQLPLLNVIAYQMAIDTTNQLSTRALNLNDRMDYLTAKIQLRNCVRMN